MSQIRKQSIISTVLILIGFVVGFFNNLIFTKNNWFTPDQYALTRCFFDFSQIIFAYSFLGLNAVIYKFSPYYKGHLKDKDNDLLGWSLVLSTCGFLLFLAAGFYFQPFFEGKFSANSRMLVDYYYWIYPFGFSLLIFTIMESYCWSIKRTVISNFLRETALRILTTVLIVLFVFRVINYDTFIKLFAFLYAILVVILFLYLKKNNELHLTLKVSKVTRRFWKKMIVFGLFIFAGVAVSTTASIIDSILISSKRGLIPLGIYTFSTYIANIIQIPQRSIIAISIPFLSEAWREKKFSSIQRIYQRSSINLLLIGLFLFGNIWLNYEDGITTLQLNPIYLQGKYVVLIMGIKLVIDMGTGVNGQIIGTSNFWRFEFLTGLILLVLIMPLSYFLVGRIGILGGAVSSLVAYSLYNIIRLVFLWKKFRMQPFTPGTLWSLLMGVAIYCIAYYLFRNVHGWMGIFGKTIVFSSLFIAITWYFRITPDAEPVVAALKKRLGLTK